jgi:hypothetical protein
VVLQGYLSLPLFLDWGAIAWGSRSHTPPHTYVTKVLQECYKSVTRVLHECYKSVTRVLQECYKSVTRVLQGCYKSVTRVLPECYKGVTRMLQECYKSVMLRYVMSCYVSRLGCNCLRFTKSYSTAYLKGVTRVLQG